MVDEISNGERIGSLLAGRRRCLGLSEEDVARRLIDISGRATLTRTDVWRWETEYEGRTPGPQWLPHLAEVLRLPEDTLRRARAASRAARRFRVGTPPAPDDVIARLLPVDTEFAPCGTTSGRTVGMADAEALLRRVHGLRLADDVLAGGDLVETVVRELRAAIALHDNTCHSEAVGRRLLTGVGELAQLAGWVATDSGGKADPAPLFRLGVAATEQAGDRPLTAHLLGSWGYWEANPGVRRRRPDRARRRRGDAGPRRVQLLRRHPLLPDPAAGHPLAPCQPLPPSACPQPGHGGGPVSARGFFLTVDGPGGIGKSTTVPVLAQQLHQAGHTVYATTEPSSSPLGMATRRLANDVRGTALALLVAADRNHHLATEIRPRLTTGHTVVCDRYLPSSLVLQRLDGVPPDFIRAVNAGIDLPDLAVILTASADTIARRLVTRGSHHRFEDDLGNVQRELDLYEQAIPILEAMSVRVVRIDVDTLTPEGAAAAILHAADFPSATVQPAAPSPRPDRAP
ncbi:dTMP kinase [Streptomyces sp. NPDC092296]|uniref:dTMP kinase n=1 Tax=Streptomyces sp. NPDC092296 TaxID=3366012 RepID=UPI0037FD1B2B